MKRLVRDGRVLYVRRHFGWSILFISLSFSIVLYAWLFPSPDKGELGIALYYGVPLAVAGMVATLRAQVVAIDPGLGRVLFLDRRLFRFHRRFRDLSRLSVRLTSVRAGRSSTVHHFIWIEVTEDRSFLFRQQHGGVAPRAAAEQLAADLGRPLTNDAPEAMIVAATPIDPPDGEWCWRFHFVNNSEEPVESVVVDRVDYEWGDMGNGEAVGAWFGPVPPRSSVEIYKEIDTEVRTSLTLTVRGPAGSQRIVAEFGKLYSTPGNVVPIPIVDRLGKVASLHVQGA